MRILVLGASGMLGNAVMNHFAKKGQHETWGTLRSQLGKKFFTDDIQSRLISSIDVLNQETLLRVFADIRPDVVINCVGLIKQLKDANDPLQVLPLNAMFPHHLAKLCTVAGTRLIHISTDCVFSGNKGRYTEMDESDAKDLYGKSKYIGELHDYAHVITLRTSIIGHELNSNHALVDWFLSQQDPVKGFTKAIFSGLPTIELAEVIHDLILPQTDLHGLYHVSASPITKFDLLNIVAEVYEKEIVIQPDDEFVIDRSLDSSKFQQASGYRPTDWHALIEKMHKTH